MAAVQRKLVHKQFNSPMGLYSQENVKATLNRELKAFGADGIEIDEQISKPLNLANSAVLRAVEEEEQQIKCGDFYPLSQRQSRSRQREPASPPGQSPHHALHQQLLDQIKEQYLSQQHDVVVDRDTVLRINRFSTRRQLLKRDHSWPPVEQQVPSAGGTSSGTHSPRQQSIEALREKFNSPTRIVEPSTRELREQRRSSPHLQQPSRSACRAETPLQEQLQLTPQARGFSAPETKAADADLGLVAPKCEYYEQLTHKRPATPTVKAPTHAYRPRLKRQSYSLDRGRARKRALALGGGTELPPPKPRNGTAAGVGGVGGAVGVAGAAAAGNAGSTPRVQRRSIKLATELRICYDGDSEEEPKASPSPGASSCGADIDLETLPLPAPPRAAASRQTVDSRLALKQQQQLALALATGGLSAVPQQLEQRPDDDDDHGARIIPVRLASAAPAAAAAAVAIEPQLEARVQRMYEDACSYLGQDMTPPAKTDEAQAAPATYVSATSGIKLQRQESRNRMPPRSSCIPTPPPLPPPPQPPLLLRAKSQDKQQQQQQAKQTRRQGCVYSEEESPAAQARQHEAHVEIAQLEAKYAHIQQSITEHLRQIDAYMENAKTALQRTVQATPVEAAKTAPPPPQSHNNSNNNNNELWDMFASRQSPILAVESPLQAILRQIYCRAAGIQLQPKEQQQQQQSLPLEACPVPAENVPIVERALEDLHKIAIALDCEGQAKQQEQQQQQQLLVQHTTTPRAAEAEHVLIEEEEEQQQEQEQAPVEDLDLEYRHVSDVIANYEQLSGTSKEQAREAARARWEDILKQQQQQLQKAGKEQPEQQQQQQEKPQEKGQRQQEKQQKNRWQKQQPEKDQQENQEQPQKNHQEKEQQQQQQRQQLQPKQELLQKLHKELQQAKQTQEQQESEPKQQQRELKEQQKQPQEERVDVASTCPHESAADADILGSWCAVCGECRESPHGWGKLNKADQWRFDNLQNEPLANYKSTYEIRSPYISRQISWEDTQQQQQPDALQRQRSEVEIVTTPAPPSAVATALAPLAVPESQLSRSPSPQPLRRYPAPLIDTAQRCSSPFGLNAVQRSASPATTPTSLEAKYTHVPQLEGHNIGLLVRTATEPLQLSMSASSSLLAAATPPATPRCNSQPPPFDFLMQHGLGPQAEFQSIAAHDSRDFSFNRSFDNVSPRPYIGIEGYKRVAWPPASEERIVREFTPQPPTQSPAPGSGGYYPQPTQAQAPQASGAPAAAAVQPQYRAPSHDNYQQQQPQQQQQQPAPQWQQQQQQPAPQWQQQQQQQPPLGQAQQQYQAPYQSAHYQQQQQQPQQQPIAGANYAQPQYNSYSQPQQQPLQQQQQQLPYSQDQTDQLQQQQSYRGASPGIITLRKETPVSQQPAPVYTSQPVAVSYQGGSKLRGDLKWPPPEYKEAAVRENEERRLLALGPVCRPRRVNRDYTSFFAKNQLNCTYPSYKVPPGTQHMFA
ncbi:hypothetical protein KR222_000968 [Zaprionus bogoriensis]|nr:hypothetical protein KR222_000968 [Zaprionus bogoriensis]